MTNKYKLLSVLIILLIVACSSDEKIVFVQGAEPVPAVGVDTDVEIKDVAGFGIGAAVKKRLIETDQDYKDALVASFNQITAEFEMKMAEIWTSPTSYNWEAADFLVDFAETNDMEVHAHTLVWHNSIPTWLVEENNDSIVFEAKVKTYITDVVGRYKGKVKSWDVVNEVFADGGGLRDNTIIAPLFNDPIGFYGRCFQYTKDADPDAKLFYNDFTVVVDEGKRTAIKNMIARFQSEGIPIDGVGDQFHYETTTNKGTIEEGFNDIASTGLLIHISELDIKVNVNRSDAYVFSSEQAQIQSDTYEFIVGLYNALPESQKFAITTWGVGDKYTWLTDFWHPLEFPLLFDTNFNKKKAYEGFLKGLN